MKTLGVLLCAFCLCSCEKNINFKLKEAPDVLVVDANIEEGQPPLVILSKSFDYFSKISQEKLDSSFVHNATVTITDGNVSKQLKEYAVDSAGGYVIYYYTSDTSNASLFTGKVNTSYSLKILTDNQEYDATTTIPFPGKKLDSLWWRPTPFAKDTTQVDVFVQATDPPGLGNYIRYYTKVNSQPFLPGQQSVFDDELIDGTTYNLKITPGIDRNNPIAFD